MKTKKKILIADDEQDVLDFLEHTFIAEGFEVATAKDGIQALKKANSFYPDLFLLDIKMPKLEGIALCEQLRSTDEFKTTPIVFLTAQNTEAVEVEAFNIGANDFITKPIKPKALLIRINRLLPAHTTTPAKIKYSSQDSITRLGNIDVNNDEYKITSNGKDIFFAKKEFQIIQLLATKPGKVFTRAEIFKKVWGDNLIMTDRTIDVHIRKIRIKAGDDFIRTVKGVGFKVEG